MTYDLKVERLIDAPPELVFDTVVDPAFQEELFDQQVPGWSVRRFEIDLRVGGTWTIEFGPSDGSGPNDVLTSVFSHVDPPRRLTYRTSMFVTAWGRTVSFTEEMTFEDRDGKTLVTVVQADIESEADRDAFMGGTPGWVESLQRVVESRMAAARHGNG
jgi:uncharacterized protein YndB with AHSA1/START domain